MNNKRKGAGFPAQKSSKPSKGGRTARAPEARMTPADLAALKAILSARGLSFGDWLHEHIAADSQEV
jgi:hypothetical protein